MDSVVILIAAPGSRAISPAIAKAAGELTGSAPEWLHENEALQFPSRSLSAGERAEIGRLVKDQPIDVALLAADNRRKRLLIADMDSTMIGQECIDELGELAGVGDRIKVITASAMKGELDFEAALKARLALIRDLPQDAIGRILRERITFRPGGQTLVVAKHLGFDEHRANELLMQDGRLTGEVREPILGKDAKLAALRQIAREKGIALADTLAVGDGANDIPMLKAAGLGVALHAKPKVREAASVSVTHGDLTALLYLQGYRRAEFAGSA